MLLLLVALVTFFAAAVAVVGVSSLNNSSNSLSEHWHILLIDFIAVGTSSSCVIPNPFLSFLFIYDVAVPFRFRPPRVLFFTSREYWWWLRFFLRFLSNNSWLWRPWITLFGSGMSLHVFSCCLAICFDHTAFWKLTCDGLGVDTRFRFCRHSILSSRSLLDQPTLICSCPMINSSFVLL